MLVRIWLQMNQNISYDREFCNELIANEMANPMAHSIRLQEGSTQNDNCYAKVDLKPSNINK